MLAQFLLSLLVTTTLAAPGPTCNCDVPATALNLSAPFTFTSAPFHAVTVGYGVQNYTRNATGSYVTAGAVATLLDICGHYGNPDFADIQDKIFNTWSNSPGLDPSDPDLIKRISEQFKAPLLGYHYFINDTGVLRAKFDFTSTGPTKGNPNAFVIGNKTADVLAPNHQSDVDWLELASLSGQFADNVFRVFTKGGQPNTTCTPGSCLTSIKYAAKYWFEGGSL